MFIPIPENIYKALICLICCFTIGVESFSNSSIHFHSVDFPKENAICALIDPDTILLELYVGQSDAVCLSDAGLSGPIVTAANICLATNVFDEFLGNDFCVEYSGAAIGSANSCYVACDVDGNCDTTVVEIDVVPYHLPPGISDDTTTTLKGTPVLINPISNDTIFGGIVEYGIIAPPISGSVQINLDGSLTYSPDDDFCARWDHFSYELCNPIGCDTATVSVFIECVEITVFNAISPNNDGVNDYFFIAKIENFPNNRVWVYNRWGSLVFDSGSNGYSNNWPGTWADETDLPDGSYFYILEWSEGDGKQVKRGFVELIR